MSDDPVRWLADDRPHPARDAQRNALSRACAGDREGWLALWAEDCEIHDPVGPSIFDAEGRGHHGLSGAAHFWDVAIAPVERFEVEIRASYASGDSAAQEGTFRTWFPDGSSAEIDLVTVYRVTESGQIASMRAYWELDRVRSTTRD